MEVKIFPRDTKSYIEVENTGDADQTVNFKVYSCDETDHLGDLILSGNHTVTPEKPITQEIETLPDGISNTIYRVVIGDKTEYFPRGTLGDSTTTATEVVDTLVKLLKIPGWENNNKHPKSMSGWDPVLKKWFPHGSAEGGKKTIAYGHKVLTPTTKVTIGGQEKTLTFALGITEEEAVALLRKDVETNLGLAHNFINDGCDANWNSLDFWGKVLVTELFFNMSPQAAKEYKNLRASLVFKNYGTKADEGKERTGWNVDGTPNATTWGHFWRKYRKITVVGGVTTKTLVPLSARNEFIEKHIVCKLEQFKRDN